MHEVSCVAKGIGEEDVYVHDGSLDRDRVLGGCGGMEGGGVKLRSGGGGRKRYEWKGDKGG